MPTWLAGNEIEAISALIAVLAFAIAIRAEIRIRRIQGLSFPGVTAEWAKQYSTYDVIKSDAFASPPCPAPVSVVTVKIVGDSNEYQIAAFRLRRLDYGLGNPAFYETAGNPPRAWIRRYYQSTVPDAGRGKMLLAYLDASNVAGPPRHLKVKVERSGGIQVSCWQLVPIRPSD